MNAGKIEIAVEANYSGLERQLKQTESVARSAGSDAGKSFGYSFSDKFNEQAKGILGQLAGPMIASQVARGLAKAIASDKGIVDGTNEVLKAIPYAGGFVELGNSLFDLFYENTFGASEKAARDYARRAEIAYQEELDAAAKLEEEKAKAAQEKAKSVSDLRNQLAAAEADRRIQLLESTGRKEQAIEAKKAKEVAALTEEMNARVAQVKTEDEKKLIRDLYETRIATAQQTANDEIVQARIRAGEQAKAKAEAERSEQERLRDEQARKEEEDFRKSQERYAQLEALSEDMARIEEERIQSQTAGITSQQTAAGSFRFDAYPDSMKKKNDEASLQKLDAIRQTIAEKAGFI